jgi:hypothetical protein
MSLSSSRSSPFLACIAFVFSLAGVCVAADDYKKGDAVEVFFLGEWRPATVVEVDKRGNVGAEYEFAGGPQRRAFKPAEVRAAYESGAMARGRMWSDTSGKFRVKAALLKINDDDSVTIRKDDMAELKIPLKNLSEADNKYIKTFKKEAAAIAAAARKRDAEGTESTTRKVLQRRQARANRCRSFAGVSQAEARGRRVPNGGLFRQSRRRAPAGRSRFLDFGRGGKWLSLQAPPHATLVGVTRKAKGGR